MLQKQNLIELYQSTRAQTIAICKPLSTEDYIVQSIDDVSPPKWHLVHTTWFFEIFVLLKWDIYTLFDADFIHRFNSYYQQIGCPYPKSKRGLLSRPTVERVKEYRAYVDTCMLELMNSDTDVLLRSWDSIILGLNHEQQHQEWSSPKSAVNSHQFILSSQFINSPYALAA